VTEVAYETDVACSLCGGPLVNRYAPARIWYQPAGSRAYGVNWCAGCDFGLLAPRPTIEEHQGFHTAEYFEMMAQGVAAQSTGTEPLLEKVRVHLAWRLDRGEPLNAQFVHRVLGGRPGSVCDIGSGSGALLAGLAELGHQTVGVEPSEHARARAAKRGVESHAGLAESLPEAVKRQKYDAIVMKQVLEHCLDAPAALRNLTELLKKGGRVCIEVPNNHCVASEEQGPVWFHRDTGRHVNFFTPRSLERLAESLGLRVEKTFYSLFVSQFTPYRLAMAQMLWDHLDRENGAGTRPECKRPSAGGFWRLLAKSALSAAPRKYEVFGIVAERTH
jgi:2-polyprenyl-3-methyl-5-hydroxy-6-metoxy-1,4-benzoquinol methylase